MPVANQSSHEILQPIIVNLSLSLFTNIKLHTFSHSHRYKNGRIERFTFEESLGTDLAVQYKSEISYNHADLLPALLISLGQYLVTIRLAATVDILRTRLLVTRAHKNNIVRSWEVAHIRLQ